MIKTIKICKSSSCDNCKIQKKIKCHFNLIDLIIFYLLSIPPFLYGGYILFNINIVLLVIWLLIIFLFFCVLEIKILCSHCPHYAESSLILQCWANYGLLKLWKYNPNKINNFEKALFIIGLIFVYGYPILFSYKDYSVIVYLILTVVFFLFLIIFKCKRCYNVSCLFNRLEKSVKKIFINQINK
jgi:hypothetical protein